MKIKPLSVIGIFKTTFNERFCIQVISCITTIKVFWEQLKPSQYQDKQN